jgi:hypothetical protein
MLTDKTLTTKKKKNGKHYSTRLWLDREQLKRYYVNKVTLCMLCQVSLKCLNN